MDSIEAAETFLDASSPTRGMWIEIRRVQLLDCRLDVIPHTGDVD